MTPQRESEILDAVELLHALCQPPREIGRKLDLSETVVRQIIKTKRIPQVQRDLFAQPMRDEVSTK
ncbi:MAG: hypothetical protein JNL58_31290 [Planctomyces sp.]|nr:hypothetical protein [Planctomyces sp.]